MRISSELEQNSEPLSNSAKRGSSLDSMGNVGFLFVDFDMLFDLSWKF
jgi:hypothetical protein